MTDYSLEYEPGWDAHYASFDSTTQARILKKMLQCRQPLKHRHLKHGAPYFVEEIGGYCIVLSVDEEEKKKKIIFIGTHKQYEKWYKSI